MDLRTFSDFSSAFAKIANTNVRQFKDSYETILMNNRQLTITQFDIKRAKSYDLLNSLQEEDDEVEQPPERSSDTPPSPCLPSITPKFEQMEPIDLW